MESKCGILESSYRNKQKLFDSLWKNCELFRGQDKSHLALTTVPIRLMGNIWVYWNRFIRFLFVCLFYYSIFWSQFPSQTWGEIILNLNLKHAHTTRFKTNGESLITRSLLWSSCQRSQHSASHGLAHCSLLEWKWRVMEFKHFLLRKNRNLHRSHWENAAAAPSAGVSHWQV